MATDGPLGIQPPAKRLSFAALYGNRTMLVLLALGFAGGLPNVMVTKVAQAWTSAAHWDVAAIGALSAWTLPYAFKFAWAPLVDSLQLPLLGRLGRRRSWLLASQVLAMAALLALSLWGPLAPDAPDADAHNGVFLLLLLAAAFFSATQDIVGDAFRAECLQPEQLGAGASMFVSGYRVAFVALGGGVMLAAGTVSWSVACVAASAAMLLGIVATLQAREPAQNAGARPGLRDAVVRPLGQFWQVWGLRSLVLAAFVLLFKLPDQMAGAITTPLLMNGLGYSSEAIGGVNQVFGFGMTIVGAAAGGWMVARFGLVRCLWAFGIAHCVSIVGFLVLALAYGATVKAVPAVAPPIWPLIPVIGVENVVIGMVTSGFVAFLMQICDRRYTATQYALLTALMAAGNALAGKFGGMLAAQLDYPLFLVAAMLSGVPALALIAFVQPPESSGPSKTA